jgi:hypothetical protein
MTVAPEEAAAADGEVVVAPGKALRLADMIDALVQEIHAAPLDEIARARFLELYQSTLVEVGSTLSDELLEELARMQTASINDGATFDELRVAMTQLEGWLHGVLLGVLTGSTSFTIRDDEPHPDAEPTDAAPTDG